MPSDPKYDYLYEIPVEELGLSDKTIRIVKRTGITSVGDCVDFFERAGQAMETAPFDFFKEMRTVVETKLEEHGYWPLDKIERDGRV
jgi:hypothetical protein